MSEKFEAVTCSDCGTRTLVEDGIPEPHQCVVPMCIECGTTPPEEGEKVCHRCLVAEMRELERDWPEIWQVLATWHGWPPQLSPDRIKRDMDAAWRHDAVHRLEKRDEAETKTVQIVP